MNTPSNAVPETPVDARGVAPAPAAASATRPMYWSVLRELWENRSITIAPLAVAAFVLLGFLISTVRVPARMRAVWALDPAKRLGSVAMPYNVAAAFLILTAFVIAVFYCLEALHSERRDRSILFWKSLPVSDLTTVLSKASIPLLVLPLLTFAVILATQTIMLLLSSAMLLGNSPSIAMLWARLPLFRMSLGLLYALAAMALWLAPLYAWLLLVSGWARRAPFLWAFSTAGCDQRGREDRVQHFVCRVLHERPLAWLGYAGFPPSGAAWHPGQSVDATHSGDLPEHAESLDRAGIRRDLPRRGGAAAPLSRADLIHQRQYPMQGRRKCK